MAGGAAIFDGRRSMLGDEVYERAKALLMDHAIAPGGRISIDGLARDFAVSQTPVREALARLESEGLVVKIPLRGYRATPLLTQADVADLFQLRMLIEPWAARRAAERVDDRARAALRAEVDSVAAPLNSSYEAYRPLAAHDSRFHGLVAELSGSEQVRLALERTHFHLHIFRLRWDRAFGPDTLAEHRRIAELIIEGRAPEAEAAMVAHLDAGLHTRISGVL